MKSLSISHGLILAMLASPLLAESVTLTPEEDTDVYQFTSYPTSSTHSLGVNVSNNSGHSQRSLVRFAVTTASTRATAETLASATLRLYVLPDATTGSGFGGTVESGDIAIFTQGGTWSAATARWSTVTPADHIGDLAISKASTGSRQVWVEVDATTAVRSWLSGASNNGFVIQGLDENAADQVNVNFASMETGFPPELVITTGGIPPEVEQHVRPVVRVIGKVPRKVSKRRLIIRGRVTASDPVTAVRYQVNGGRQMTASGKKRWKAVLKLTKGRKHRVRIVATDASGDRSRSERFTVRRK